MAGSQSTEYPGETAMQLEEKFSSPRVEESGRWNLVSPSSGKVSRCVHLQED